MAVLWAVSVGSYSPTDGLFHYYHNQHQTLYQYENISSHPVFFRICLHPCPGIQRLPKGKNNEMEMRPLRGVSYRDIRGQ